MLALIVAAGIGLRLYRLPFRSVWFDEASSWRTIQFPWREMLERVARNNHLPLHYALLKAWTAVWGDSVMAMRGLSIVFAGVTLVATYLFASEAFRGERVDLNRHEADARWIGLASALLAACSPLQIHVAWEARMYTLGTALVMLSSWTLFRALRGGAEPNARPARRWALHSVVTLLLAYTHNFALFSIAGQIVFLLFFFLARRRNSAVAPAADRDFRGALVSYGAVALGWGLWLPVLLRQVQQVEQDWWTGPLSLPYVLGRAYDLAFDGLTTVHDNLAGLAVAFALFAVLLTLARTREAGAWYVVSLAVVPIVAGIAASLIGKNILVLRYLVFAQLFLLIGFAAAIAQIFGRWQQVVLALAVAGSLGIFGVATAIEDSPRRPGIRGVVEFIESHRRPGEEVIVSVPVLYFPAQYYFHEPAICHLFNDGSPLPHYSGAPIVVPGDLIKPEQIDQLSHSRVWVVASADSIGIPVPSHWRLLGQKSFPEVFGRHGDPRVLEYEAE
jgi:uncharacterized membrane protein